MAPTPPPPPVPKINLHTPIIASLSLGLAPFVPEPHVLGKLRWVAGGAVGMEAMDWGDLVLHGFPWVWLIVALVRTGLRRRRVRTV